MRMIFVNLPVKNIETSRAFFTTLGFTFNPEYSDDRTLCMIVEENIFVMLLQEERFRDFINGDIADAKRSTEVLTCLSAGSREEIDRMIEAAL
ncbi:VOC family protein, partial [Mesorhizobium sp. M8A.F.Ca.ET.182.01.1.1]